MLKRAGPRTGGMCRVDDLRAVAGTAAHLALFQSTSGGSLYIQVYTMG